MDNHNFSLELCVRDYECDVQGIVNNAVYQNYLEHTRHVYLKSKGIDFVDLALKGINLVVTRAEIDYKYPLKSGDEFIVTAKIVKESPLRFAFYQNIYRKTDNKLIVKAKITGTSINKNGRPVVFNELKALTDD
jgi:acyl-CoA thioester hydrolase